MSGRVPPRVADAVWERDASRCFRCQRLLHRNHGGYSIHHRLPGGMGGDKTPAYWRLSRVVLLCGSGTTGCHGWVERNRPAAEGQGFIVRHGADPAVRPINRWQREWVILDDEGAVMRKPY
jgi:hypothetical protein